MKCWEVPTFQVGLLSLIQGSKTRLYFHLQTVETKSVIGTLYTHRVTLRRNGVYSRGEEIVTVVIMMIITTKLEN